MEDLSGIDQRKLVAESATEVCKECGGVTFREVYILKKISALYSGNGKGTLYPIPVYACNNCGAISPTICEDPNYDNIIGKSKVQTN